MICRIWISNCLLRSYNYMEDGKKHRESQPSVSLNFSWEARNGYTKKKKKTFKHIPLGKRVEKKFWNTHNDSLPWWDWEYFLFVYFWIFFCEHILLVIVFKNYFKKELHNNMQWLKWEIWIEGMRRELPWGCVVDTWKSWAWAGLKSR